MIEENIIILTEKAAKEIHKILKEQELSNNPFLRVGVKGGGCSGFSYILDITETKKDTDELIENHGISVICDPKSLLYLQGTTIDFKDEIMGRGFIFSNPNAVTKCGCNQSFSV